MADVVAETGVLVGSGRRALVEDARTVQVGTARALLLDVAGADALSPGPVLQ